MKITLIPPSEIEAKVVVNESGTLIEPRFPSSKCMVNVCSIIVKGNKGKERRYSVYVSGGQGRVSVAESKSVESDFDK